MRRIIEGQHPAQCPLVIAAYVVRGGRSGFIYIEEADLMNVLFYLNERTKFIRQLYKTTSKPYLERIRKIECEEEPFISNCIYSEEPAFLEEYSEAMESIQELRLMYFSMITCTLHTYFKTWQNELRFSEEKIDTKKGWLTGYKKFFHAKLAINFECAPISLKDIEQIVRVRNNIEHRSSITSRVKYNNDDYDKLEKLSYINDFDANMLKDLGWNFLGTSIEISEEQLLEAISKIEIFSQWLNDEIQQLSSK